VRGHGATEVIVLTFIVALRSVLKPMRLDPGREQRPAGVRTPPAGSRADIAVSVLRGVLAALEGAGIAHDHAQLQRHANHAEIGRELSAQHVRCRGTHIRAVEVEPDATPQRAIMLADAGVSTGGARLGAFDTGVDARAQGISRSERRLGVGAKHALYR
jgi:hypothetical protein